MHGRTLKTARRLLLPTLRLRIRRWISLGGQQKWSKSQSHNEKNSRKRKQGWWSLRIVVGTYLAAVEICLIICPNPLLRRKICTNLFCWFKIRRTVLYTYFLTSRPISKIYQVTNLKTNSKNLLDQLSQFSLVRWITELIALTSSKLKTSSINLKVKRQIWRVMTAHLWPSLSNLIINCIAVE